jgi:hypothetical protein
MKKGIGRFLLTGTLGVVVLALALFVACAGSNGTSVKAEEVSAAQAEAAAADRQLLGLHVWPGWNAKIPADQQPLIRNEKIEITWSSVETAPGTYDFTASDALINSILAAGSQSIFVLLGGPVPAWEQDPQYGALMVKAPPLHLNSWYNFCAATAEHYANVVDFYEIWNEPGWDRDSYAMQHSNTYHFGGNVETDYLPLLQLGYAAVKAKDPSASVFCGALIYNLNENPNDGQQLYAQLFDEVNRPGQDVSMKIDADKPIVAERPMYFNYKNAWNGGHDAMGSQAARTEWYFAEGCTRPGFDTWLCLQNPQGTDAAVGIDYFCGDGNNVHKDLSVGANSRFTIPVHETALGIGQSNSTHGDVSIKVTSTQAIVAERPMYFNYNGVWTGGHDAMGAAAPQTDWYFAEGCTRPGFNTWLCLQNPGDAVANIGIDYLCGDGNNVHKDVPVNPHSRFTVPVHQDGLGIGQFANTHGDVSIKITSSQPVVAERPMYFNYNGVWNGGHDAMGANAPQTEWYFAEGCTRPSFNTWLCIQNPGADVASVGVDYLCGDGNNVHKDFAVNPTSRFTVPVHGDTLGIGRYDNAHGDVSIKVTSSTPVVVERPMYFNYNNAWTGGHDAMGTSSPQSSWYFAEGCTGFSIQEYVCLQNPNPDVATATITFMMTKGEQFTRSVSLPGSSRVTLDINRLIGFSGSCDMVALHPYKSPKLWGPFYTTVVNTLRSKGAGQEVVVTEVGWPHYNDQAPSAFNDSYQQVAIGDWGVGGLFRAGCRKIWVFKDYDEDPGTSWDGNYYGLWSYNGVPHPAWSSYVGWQAQLPSYPLLPPSL